MTTPTHYETEESRLTTYFRNCCSLYLLGNQWKNNRLSAIATCFLIAVLCIFSIFRMSIAFTLPWPKGHSKLLPWLLFFQLPVNHFQFGIQLLLCFFLTTPLTQSQILHTHCTLTHTEAHLVTPNDRRLGLALDILYSL